MSDYNDADGRPPVDVPELEPATVNEEIYVYHHGGVVGLEVGVWNGPTVTLGLSAQGARSVARDLLARADEIDGRRP